MKSTDWQEIKKVFIAACELPESERMAFLDDCHEDLRPEVEKLLKANDSAGDFINESAFIELGLASEDETDFYVGKQIDSYRIIKEVGQGGMGTVYLANRADESFDKPVALKLIKRGMDTNAVLKRFVMERKILAQLEHPNIAGLRDGGSTTDGLPYLVMEYVDGESITKFCDSHNLDTDSRLELFQKVCSAISFAHQNLVVHRDIKPSNILVTGDGTPKLLDFGIAKLLHPDWSLDTNEATATMFRVMTPEYASPEQLRGMPITTASDVYSLGVVLYELLSGERPFKIESRLPGEIAQIVSTEDPIKPSWVVSREARGKSLEPRSRTDANGNQTIPDDVNPKSKTYNLKSLRGDLDNIILKALRKEPERRYASVQEFSEDIRRHLAGLPVTAMPDTSVYRVKKFVRRHRVGVAASFFVATLLVAATAITAWQSIIANTERARAERRFADVRQLANSLVFELHDSIQDLPGSTPSRELLVSRALEYLDKLAGEGNVESSLQLELAAAYDKIGDIQGGLHSSHLGQRQKAAESIQKALTIRETLVAAKPGDDEFRRQLAISYTKMAQMKWVEVDVAGSLEFYGKALAVYKALAEELPGDAGIRFSMAVSRKDYSYSLGADGRLDESVADGRNAIAALEEFVLAEPNNDDYQSALADAYGKLGEIFTSLGEDHEQGLLLYRKGQTISDKIYFADPANTTKRRHYALSFLNIAQIMEKMDDTAAALDDSSKALAIFQDMSLADPQNEDLREAVADIQGAVAKLLIKRGKPAEAIKLLTAAHSTLEKLFAASPTDEIVRFRIATVEGTFGHGYSALASDNKTPAPNRLAHWREARSWFQKSLEIYKSFRDSGKSTGEDAATVDLVTEEIAKCDAAISLLAARKAS